MLDLIKLYSSQLKLAGILAILLFTGYLFFRVDFLKKDLTIAENTIDTYKAESKRIIEAEKQKTKDQEHITQVVSDSYQLQLKQLKDYYAKHPNTKLVYASELHQPTTRSETFETKLSETTRGINESFTNTPVVEEYQPTVEDAAETTLMLESLQKWVQDQETLCKQYQGD